MSQEDEFLRELKVLFKRYGVRIHHSLDYDYDEEICADTLYISNDRNPPDSFMISLVGTELETKLSKIRIG